MYKEWGVIPEPRRFAEMAPLLSPKRSEQGYATTDREATRELFEPILRDVFPGKWVGASLAIIWNAGSIYPHQDSSYGLLRLIAVLQTGRHSWSLHDGIWQQLEEGKVYEMDPLKEHASVYWGEEPRIHLVVDIQPWK